MSRRLCVTVERCRGQPDRGTSRAGGFTLLELAIVVVVSSVLIGAAVTVVSKSEAAFADQVRELTLNQLGQQVTSRLATELRAALPSTVLPFTIANSNTIQYQKVVGYSGGSALLGPQVTVRFQLAPGEVLNGSDDNADGRADEGVVTYQEGAGTEVPIAGHVLGLRFNPTTAGISFAVDIGILDRDRTIVQKTYSQAVSFRNAE
jgi:prepilin-type N-terminal cleavage/methylation domain-containing protein